MSFSGIDSGAATAAAVIVSEDVLSVELTDGRTISVPLVWYPRLLHATTQERGIFRLIGGGHGIHWLEVDEDISVGNLLAGRPSCESQASFKKWLTDRAKPVRASRRPKT